MLSKAGFLKAQRGSQGGYRMMKDPSKYTIGDILRVTEGSLAPVSCLDDEVNECPKVGECPTIKLWEGLYKNITEYLGSVTIADLMEKAEATDADLCYYI
jgi:Rrf2 family protein